MSAAVSQALPVNVNVEETMDPAAVGSDRRPQQQPDDTTTTAAPAPAEEPGAAIEDEPYDARAGPFASSRERALDATGVAFFMVLAFAGGVS